METEAKTIQEMANELGITYASLRKQKKETDVTVKKTTAKRTTSQLDCPFFGGKRT